MAYSYVTYTGNGTQQAFAVPFPFISRTDVAVYVDGVLAAFTWTSDTLISITAAPPAGSVVLIQRTTPITSKLYDFIHGGRLSEDDLDGMSNQLFYALQEDRDDGVILAEVQEDLADISTALTATFTDTASAAVTAAEGARDDALLAQGAAEGARDDALLAQSAAEGARDDAQTAQGLAEAARDKAQDWADEAYNVEVESGKYSAKHWSTVMSLAIDTLVADYQRYTTNRNLLINPSMRIDQRKCGAAQTITKGTNVAYCVDRWFAYCTGANVAGQRGTIGTSTLTSYVFTGAASVTGIVFGQRIEQCLIGDLTDKVVTLSFYTANSLLTSLTWTANYPTSTIDTYGTVASPTKTQIGTGSVTISSTLTRYEVSFTVPAAAAAKGIEILLSVGAQTSGTWEISDVQLEVGATATPVERRPYPLELLLCKRYYETSYALACAPGAVTNVGAHTFVPITALEANNFGSVRFQVDKRATPTVTLYSPTTGTAGQARDYVANADRTATARTQARNGFEIQGSGWVIGNGMRVHYTADSEI